MTTKTIPPTPNPPPPSSPSPAPTRLLIINPNTTQAMTNALSPAITSLSYPPSLTQIHYFTCPGPGGIASINAPSDAAASAEASIPHLRPLLGSYDAFLVACYSEHPLVKWLAREFETSSTSAQALRRKYVTGIFEASVTASLSLIGSLGSGEFAFGIVSTGKVWEGALRSAVEGFLGARTGVFLGCETTGLDADQLHRLPAVEVRAKMRLATGRLVESGERTGRALRAVCLGCAGMVGLEEAVREELVERLGGGDGWKVAIVDGVKAGVGELLMLARAGF